MNNIKEQTKKAVCELIETAKLTKGQILVVGCSSSEIAGQKIGTGSTVEIAKEVKKRGASLMNILPLIPLAKMKHYSRPDCSMMESVREQVEEIIPVFRACTQCRADAYGIPGKKSEDHHLGMTPQSHY